MANYYAQGIVYSASGRTEDVWVNNFAVTLPDEIDNTQMDDWRNAIIQFYEDCKLAGAMRGRERVGNLVKIYAADGSVPNYPIREDSWNFAASMSALDMPEEVALCVSYADTVTSSIPRARRRGRIYISGWGESNNTAGRPSSTTVDDLVDAYKDYADTVNAITDVQAGIWSRAEAAVFAVDTCWVDNEWDTMRSRGTDSTSRETRTI